MVNTVFVLFLLVTFQIDSEQTVTSMVPVMEVASVEACEGYGQMVMTMNKRNWGRQLDGYKCIRKYQNG